MSEPLPIEVDVLVGRRRAGRARRGVLADPTARPAHPRAGPGVVGQSWLDPWDSLALFTPRRFSSLPGLRFPGGSTRCPTRTEMADSLRTYVEHHGLPVRTGVDVEGLTAAGDGLIVETSAGSAGPG